MSVLVVLSHVVHGYVGNRAMAFPLQYCGWDVDAVNTTNFSNHPGYGSFSGKTSDCPTIEAILEGLHDLQLKYDMVITGYISSADTLTMISTRTSQLMSSTTSWILDPVMGDSGRLYVSEDLIPVYKQILADGRVNLTTPNQFEFETLINFKIHSQQDLICGIEKFQNLYKVDNLVITSILVDNQMISVGVNQNQIFYLPVNQVDCHFNGSGDVFAALLANRFHEKKTITPEILSDCLVKIHNILIFTYNKMKQIDPSITNIRDLDIIGLKKFLLQDNDQELLQNLVYLKNDKE